MSHHRWDHHPPCRCGCGELADECSGPRPNPLGSIRIVAAVVDAEAEQLRLHRAGECYPSEWSCTHCEADDEADRDKWLAEVAR